MPAHAVDIIAGGRESPDGTGAQTGPLRQTPHGLAAFSKREVERLREASAPR